MTRTVTLGTTARIIAHNDDQADQIQKALNREYQRGREDMAQSLRDLLNEGMRHD